MMELSVSIVKQLYYIPKIANQSDPQFAHHERRMSAFDTGQKPPAWSTLISMGKRFAETPAILL
jgi:hypothetical protein